MNLIIVKNAEKRCKWISFWPGRLRYINLCNHIRANGFPVARITMRVANERNTDLIYDFIFDIRGTLLYSRAFPFDER